MLETSGSTTKYGSISALREVSLSVAAGEVVGLIGPNGAGKTTLLSTVAGLLAPAAGTVHFDGADVTGRAPDHMLKAGLALVPEHRRIFVDLTVAENLKVGGVTLAAAERPEMLDEMAELFPVLRQKWDTPAGYLSGGEAQQLAIARALMAKPRLLMMDEPSLGLAPVLVDVVFELISTLRDQGRTLINGVGLGSIYALLALGVAVIFGVMHLLNFAHGELITVSGYAAYAAFNSGWSWFLVAPLIIVVSIVTSLVIERVAFSRLRGASDFTQLLTSFGIHFLVSAVFVMYVGARVKTFSEPGWIFDTYSIGSVNVEVFDIVVIVVTIATLLATVVILQRTMFGLSLRAAAADFDTARLMGVNSDRVIRGAFALSGALAGIAGIFWLMRSGNTAPSAGIDPMLKGVLAALVGGLGSMRGAVLGGLSLGIAEVLLRSQLPG